MVKIKNKNPNKIIFKKITKIASLMSPLKNFELDKHPIEYREDSLTKKWCRINIERTKRVIQTSKDEEEAKFFEEIIDKSRATCFFCPENIESTTPQFPPDLDIPDGRIRKGEFTLFPNLYPFGEYHAVGVVTKAHFVGLNKITPIMISNGIEVCINFFKKVYNNGPEVRYPMISMNYLAPAGASIIHPHFQVLINSKPTREVSDLLEHSKEYYNLNKSNYWKDLVEIEREKDQRYIGKSGCISWLTSYAPSGNNEVIGIVTDPISSITDLNSSQINDVATGLSKIYKCLWEVFGVRSLNMTIFSGPIDGKYENYFRLNLKIITRPKMRSYYTNDTAFMERLHYEPVIETYPENITKRLAEFFKNPILKDDA